MTVTSSHPNMMTTGGSGERARGGYSRLVRGVRFAMAYPNGTDRRAETWATAAATLLLMNRKPAEIGE